MSKFKFYCTEGAEGHGNWMEPIGGVEVRKIEEADVLILGGGADVVPATYGEKPSSRTWAHPQREKIEVEDFQKAQKLGIKTVGICRGHQLLCALAGGKVIQDVTNHAGSSHRMSTYDDAEISTNSLHHQMINPYNLNPKDYNILAWSTVRKSKHYIGGEDKRMYLPITFKEIEAIHFPKIKAFGVQYHPEMMYGGRGTMNAAVDWTQRTFLKFLEGAL